MELIKNGIKVEWEDIGEGLSGQYSDSDPNDISLYRFYISKFNFPENCWEDIEDASYCTLVPTDTSDVILQQLLNYIYDRVVEPIQSGASIKKLCERLSWIDPSWSE